jgi:hypothetical protein
MVYEWVILALALYGVQELLRNMIRALRRMRRPRPFPISIVVLLHNQEEQVEALVRSLYSGAGQIGVMVEEAQEILLVDLESTDQTPAIVDCLVREHPNLRTVRLPRTQGLSACDTALFLCRSPIALVIDLRQGGASKDVLNALGSNQIWNKKEKTLGG